MNPFVKYLDRGLQPQPELILCLVSYGPLFKYPWCEMLKFRKNRRGISKTLLEPQRENQIKEEIQTLVEPNDEVSVMQSRTNMRKILTSMGYVWFGSRSFTITRNFSPAEAEIFRKCGGKFFLTRYFGGRLRNRSTFASGSIKIPEL